MSIQLLLIICSAALVTIGFLIGFGVIKIPTTMSPVTTTMKPVTTTMSPVTTTMKPVTTTMKPVTTTMSPVTTTMKPVTTAQPVITTTMLPITTTMKPVTTTMLPVTTTMLPVTTTIIPTTTTIKNPRTYTFSAGNGGTVTTIYNPGGRLWGGGGAGGIVISGVTSPSVASGNTSQNCGAAGSNGTGFGAGGGAGGNWCSIGWQTGGAGSPGFAYIIEDNRLFTTVGATTYTPSINGTYTFILMGGGGAGAGFTANNSGGCSGNIYRFQIWLTTSDVLTITIGAGGTQATSTVPAGNGGNTIVSLGGTILRSFRAVGGLAGGTVDYSTYTPISTLTNNFSVAGTNTSAALGGNSCKYSTGAAQGGTAGSAISNVLITAMNS